MTGPDIDKLYGQYIENIFSGYLELQLACFQERKHAWQEEAEDAA